MLQCFFIKLIIYVQCIFTFTVGAGWSVAPLNSAPDSVATVTLQAITTNQYGEVWRLIIVHMHTHALLLFALFFMARLQTVRVKYHHMLQPKNIVPSVYLRQTVFPTRSSPYRGRVLRCTPKHTWFFLFMASIHNSQPRVKTHLKKQPPRIASTFFGTVRFCGLYRTLTPPPPLRKREQPQAARFLFV